MIEKTRSTPFPTLELDDTSWIIQLKNSLYADQRTQSGYSEWKKKAAALPVFWPTIGRLSDEIKEVLDKNGGGCVVRGITKGDEDLYLKKWAFLLLMAQIGEPTGHDDNHALVWDVKHRGQVISREVTFSERTGEAPFHTDSAFAAHPEPFFALHAIRAAQCQGGLSRVIEINSLKRQLNSVRDGDVHMSVMEENLFPFRTPDAFSSEEKIVWAPILEGNTIKFRYDSIRRGLVDSMHDNRISTQMIESLEWFNEFVETRAVYEEFRLNDGETMIFDNRRVLHARTDYEDVERHLLRIRVS